MAGEVLELTPTMTLSELKAKLDIMNRWTARQAKQFMDRDKGDKLVVKEARLPLAKEYLTDWGEKYALYHQICDSDWSYTLPASRGPSTPKKQPKN